MLSARVRRCRFNILNSLAPPMRTLGKESPLGNTSCEI